MNLNRGWHKEERSPVKASRLVLVDPSQLEFLKDAPKVMSPVQLANLVGFSAYSISVWCRTKDIEATKVHGEWRITREAVARWWVRKSQG